MASGLFMVLDDIAALLDDAAVISKVAAKKTAGLLGDDLAVNAEKATGFRASRELPVVWAITKGSLLNKAIILPVAFLLSAFLPQLIVPILLLGGAYLSYEGVEKVLEWMGIGHHDKPAVAAREVSDPQALMKREAAKVKSAVRTDFILSIEIIVITLETVIEQSLTIQIMVVTFIALLATVGVYGLVALLVRMDDAGMHLIERSAHYKNAMATLLRTAGQGLVAALPYLIRLLGVIGTVAMLLVGGGMFVHNIDAVHHTLAFMPSLLPDLTAGLAVGTVLVVLMLLYKRISGAANKSKVPPT